MLVSCTACVPNSSLSSSFNISTAIGVEIIENKKETDEHGEMRTSRSNNDGRNDLECQSCPRPSSSPRYTRHPKGIGTKLQRGHTHICCGGGVHVFGQRRFRCRYRTQN
mmetsp:Transcript_3047/g.6903  ORF Transcript_3047/g.6903 Transcript_3047/m.6903 type:complete len:109 (+) Transcript_3047:37-363(+)